MVTECLVAGCRYFISVSIQHNDEEAHATISLLLWVTVFEPYSSSALRQCIPSCEFSTTLAPGWCGKGCFHSLEGYHISRLQPFHSCKEKHNQVPASSASFHRCRFWLPALLKIPSLPFLSEHLNYYINTTIIAGSEQNKILQTRPCDCLPKQVSL